MCNVCDECVCNRIQTHYIADRLEGILGKKTLEEMRAEIESLQKETIYNMGINQRIRWREAHRDCENCGE